MSVLALDVPAPALPTGREGTVPLMDVGLEILAQPPAAEAAPPPAALPPAALPPATPRASRPKKPRRPWKRPRLDLSPALAVSPAVAVVGLLGVLFADRLLDLVKVWQTDESYSHGWLVLPISVVLAFRVARRQGWPDEGSPRLGLACILVGCLLRFVGLVLWLAPLDFIALTAILYGLALAAGGRAWARGFRFPIAFLFFLFPLPLVVTVHVGIGLQEIVSRLAAVPLRLFLPVHRQGYLLHLPGQLVEVGDACSGQRQVLVFLALALLAAYLSRRSWLFRIGLVLGAVPVAIGANVLRVLVLVRVTRTLGLRYASGSYHTLWGLVTMTAGLGLLALLAWWLGRLLNQTKTERLSPEPAIPARPGQRATLFARLGVVLSCLAIFAVGRLGLQAHLAADDAEPPPLLGPLASFPEDLGAWHVVAGATPVAREVSPALEAFLGQADDGLDRLYQFGGGGPGTGATCALWMVHFRDGRDRTHHPLICYDVAGMPEDPAGRGKLTIEGRPEPVERFCFMQDRTRVFVFYWHYTFEPPDDGASPLRALHRRRLGRPPSLTVEVFTTATDREQLARVGDFVRQVDARLQPLLRPGTRLGSDTLPVRFVGIPHATAGGPR